MALNKRNSRPISVNGKRYRYCVSLGPSDPDNNFPLNVTVQSENGVGAKLRVIGLTTRDFWIDMPDIVPEELSETAYKSVLPRHIASWIKSAIIDGWISTSMGAPFLLETNGNLPDA